MANSVIKGHMFRTVYGTLTLDTTTGLKDVALLTIPRQGLYLIIARLESNYTSDEVLVGRLLNKTSGSGLTNARGTNQGGGGLILSYIGNFLTNDIVSVQTYDQGINSGKERSAAITAYQLL